MNLTDSTPVNSTVRTNRQAVRVQQEYSELRQLAARRMSRERSNHLLTATALANEVSMRMLMDDRTPTDNRSRFFAYASRAMGNLLVDHARAQRCLKRGGGQPVQYYDDTAMAGETETKEVRALHDALARLKKINPRRTQVVQLRYFEGMSNQEIASQLQVSLATVKRDWEAARAWLQQEMSQR